MPRKCQEEGCKKQPKINGKQVKRYSLEINSSNRFWNNIIGSNIDYDNNLLKI
jgi:hypothetical protein